MAQGYNWNILKWLSPLFPEAVSILPVQLFEYMVVYVTVGTIPLIEICDDLTVILF